MSRIAKYVSLTVKPEHEQELLERLGAVRAAAAREEGTDFWTLHAVRDQPHTYAMYEIYRDEQANAAHEELPELVDLLPRLDGLLAGPYSLVLLDELP